MNINSTFMIRKLAKTEYPQAIELSLAVFTECGKADYDEEGLETFKSFIGNEQLMDELTIMARSVIMNSLALWVAKMKENTFRFSLSNRYTTAGVSGENFLIMLIL